MSMPPVELDGRVVIVTGAAGHLAATIVPELRAAGAHVAALVRKDRDLERALDAGADEALAGDLSDEASVASCFSTIRARMGEVFGLIHAAGGWGMTPLLESPLKDWQALLDANLTSTIVAFREAPKVMTTGGRMIAFASGQGADGSLAGQGAYSAAKAGVVRLVESAAAELRHQNIAAFAIAPSTILYDDAGDQRGVSAGAVADLCLYLLRMPEPAALSGQLIRVYGTG